MARPIKVIWASEDVRSELRRRANGRSTEHRDRFRAKIILLRLDGMKIADVAARMRTSMRTVSIWSSRFEKAGLEDLADKGGQGRKPSLPAAKVARVITEVTRPPKSRSRWSVRSMGRHVGISHSTVQRIWAKNDLKPHITKTFKLSNDPQFEEKFWDVIGLYLDPPANALVLCCDEKSQCQALERTQLGLPLAPKHPRTMTHDYTRHGTVTLFAALRRSQRRSQALHMEGRRCRDPRQDQARPRRTRHRPSRYVKIFESQDTRAFQHSWNRRIPKSGRS